jgi:hypothetical protein
MNRETVLRVLFPWFYWVIDFHNEADPPLITEEGWEILSKCKTLKEIESHFKK